MISINELKEMKEKNIEALNKDNLVNINEINIDKSLSQTEKLSSFIEQIKNPYCFKCDNMPVKLCFSEDGEELEKILEKYFIHIKQN